MFPRLEIFGISISMYFLSAIIGLLFAAGFALLRRRAAHFHTSAEDILFTILCVLIGALLGAKAFQIIGYIFCDGGSSVFWTFEHWKQMLIGGVGVFYGGMIGGLAAALIYIRKSNLDFWDLADILIPSVLLFHAFGRLGCFFAGCCYGREAEWALAFNGLIPVQLFESAFNLLILITISDPVVLILPPKFFMHCAILIVLFVGLEAVVQIVLFFSINKNKPPAGERINFTE